jgi:hypothetical protein
MAIALVVRGTTMDLGEGSDLGSGNSAFPGAASENCGETNPRTTSRTGKRMDRIILIPDTSGPAAKETAK